MSKLQYPEIPNASFPDWENVHRVPIEESGEFLQPTSLAPDVIQAHPMYFKMGILGAQSECYLREGVYERLLEAAAGLPNNLKLVVLDGWRPYAVQQQLFNTLIHIMSTAYPHKSVEELTGQARNLVSPPTSSIAAPNSHITGGAVDITLADDKGRLLDMGTRFDDAGALSYTASLESISNPSSAQIKARNNRRVLYHVMSEVGFTNLPSEWWHFDFGDQLWAWYSGANCAHYGSTKPDTLQALWQNKLQ